MAPTFSAALDWREPAAPQLLREYAGRFGSDDATLLIHHGPVADVAPAADALGEGSPDMVLIERVDAVELEQRIGAVLSDAPAGDAPAGLPRLGAGDLRTLYDLRLPGAQRTHRFTLRVRREPNFAQGVWWPGEDGWPTARRPA
jgi:hypothetical protein